MPADCDPTAEVPMPVLLVRVVVRVGLSSPMIGNGPAILQYSGLGMLLLVNPDLPERVLHPADRKRHSPQSHIPVAGQVALVTGLGAKAKSQNRLVNIVTTGIMCAR